MKALLTLTCAMSVSFAQATHADGLHIECVGDGRPVVVLEAGAARTSSDWSQVMSKVARVTRVCAYDRAGLGHSAPGPLPRTALADACALSTLLREKGEAAPLVVVGHSYGGLVVRVFAAEFPKHVVGMVLVDSATEDFGQRRAELLHEPPPAYSAKSAVDWPTSFEQVKRLKTLGKKPLVVLTAGNVPPDEPAPAVKLWFEMQAALARLSTRGVHRMVPGTGHMLPLDAPGSVVQAILDVVQMARADRR